MGALVVVLVAFVCGVKETMKTRPTMGAMILTTVILMMMVVCGSVRVRGVPTKFYRIDGVGVADDGVGVADDGVAHGANATLVQSTLNRMPGWAECVPQGGEDAPLRVWCPHAPHSAVTKSDMDKMEPELANACLSLDHCEDDILLQWTDGESPTPSSQESPVRPGLLDPAVFDTAWREGLETKSGAWEEVVSRPGWERVLERANPSDVWVAWENVESEGPLALEPHVMETREVWEEMKASSGDVGVGVSRWSHLQRYSHDPLLTLGYKTSMEVAVLVTRERGNQDPARGVWVLGDAVVHFGKRRYVANRLTDREAHFPGSAFLPSTRRRGSSPFMDDAWGLDRFQLHLKDQKLGAWDEVEGPIFDAAVSAVSAALDHDALFRLPEEGGGDFDVVFVMVDLTPHLEPRVVSARIATHSLIEASTRTISRFHTHNLVSLWSVVLLDSRSRMLNPDPVLADLWLSTCDSRPNVDRRLCETVVGAWRLWVSQRHQHRVEHTEL